LIGEDMGLNPSDKYLNTKTPKCLNKSILDASGKNGITLLRPGETEMEIRYAEDMIF
jgi:hypothetical protein